MAGSKNKGKSAAEQRVLEINKKSEVDLVADYRKAAKATFGDEFAKLVQISFATKMILVKIPTKIGDSFVQDPLRGLLALRGRVAFSETALVETKRYLSSVISSPHIDEDQGIVETTISAMPLDDLGPTQVQVDA